MEYTNFNYQGIELGNQVDASAMNKLHVDIYPTTETTINVSPINTSKAGALKEGSASLGTLIANQWNSINIALSTIGVDMSAMDQFIFKGGSNGTFYMDNLYLYNDLSTSISEVATSTGITCYPNPIITNFTVSAKAEINQVIIRNLLGQSVKSIMMNGLTRTIDLSDIASGNYFITVKLANGQLSTQKILKL